jgi:UDP-N-acetyl-D-glucosamine dehydrogenase
MITPDNSQAMRETAEIISAESPILSGLLQNIAARRATIGVLGLGYVGLPLAIAFAEAGFRTLGFDTNPEAVAGLMRGQSHIGDINEQRIQHSLQNETFRASTDLSLLKQCDVVVICVPTPLTAMREPDLSAIRAAVTAVKSGLHAGQLVVLESTTYPGTTEEVVRPVLEESGLKAGEEFFLAFSPERIDPGNTRFPIQDVPKVVGGSTPACLQAACALYSSIVKQTVPVTSTQAAELTKLLENIFRSVNIALVNEMAMLCDRMKIDVWEVIDAAATKPYGFTKFLPGPGLGGHCIPIDPFYLSWKARQYDFQTSFIELAGEVNRDMPHYVVEKIMCLLNENEKAVKGTRIGLLGMSYKANVGDCRQSPSLRIAELLLELGADLRFNDPYVDQIRLFPDAVSSVILENEVLEEVLNADCVVLLTDHRDYPYAQIAQQTRLILDTRNAFKNITGTAKIVKL